jgi:hypothetical protein
MKNKCRSATVVHKLNQGTRKGMGCFIPFLNFLWLLSFFQEKESDNIAVETVSGNASRLRSYTYRLFH